MKYETILFDLDGTLTDSAAGIMNSVLYAVRQFDIEVAAKESLRPFVGPPLTDSFIKYFGMSPEQAKKAVAYYREYYNEKGMLENRLYHGVEKMLKALRDADKTIALATTKPEAYAVQILSHFGLSGYFAYVAGAHMDGTRSDKEELIRYALGSLGIAKRANVVMVGDREHDIIGAKGAGIASIGVLYGYGDREELERAGAHLVVHSVEELQKELLR
jgi:phosphoglycolate phosphatase